MPEHVSQFPERFRSIVCDFVSVPMPPSWQFEDFSPDYRIRPINPLPNQDPSIGLVEPGIGRPGAGLACGRVLRDTRGLWLQTLPDVSRTFSVDSNTVASWHFTRDRGLFGPFREIITTEDNEQITRFGETRRPHLVELDDTCRPPAKCLFLSIADLRGDRVCLAQLEVLSTAIDPAAEQVEQLGRAMLEGVRIHRPDDAPQQG
jgi:hypothetical protein